MNNPGNNPPLNGAGHQPAQILGTVDIPQEAGDAAFEIPERFVGSDVVIAYAGTQIMTDQGPTTQNEVGLLVEVLPRAIVFRRPQGETVIPKARLQWVMKLSAIATPGGRLA